MRCFVIACLFLPVLLIAACARPEHVSFASVIEQPIPSSPEKILYGGAKPQFMLHWQAPTGSHKGNLIFVHGGCWSNQFDLEHASAFAAHVAQRGYAVWSLEYRRSGDAGGGWPGSLDDVQAAIAHIVQSKPSGPIVLAGHSAGGHLALLAGSTQTTNVDAVIGLAAIARFSRYAQGTNSCQRMAQAFMQGTPDQLVDVYAQADPALQPLHPKTTLLQGQADEIVPVEQATIAGVATRLVADAGHFDWLHPQTKAFQVFIETLENLSDAP